MRLVEIHVRHVGVVTSSAVVFPRHVSTSLYMLKRSLWTSFQSYVIGMGTDRFAEVPSGLYDGSLRKFTGSTATKGNALLLTLPW